MDASEIRSRLAEIEANRSDYECAYGMEIDLYKEVLASIALCSTDPIAKEKAATALEAEDIDFARYTA